MSTENNDTAEALVAFVSGALVGAAATLLFVRIRNTHAASSHVHDDEYSYDGGDLFI